MFPASKMGQDLLHKRNAIVADNSNPEKTHYSAVILLARWLLYLMLVVNKQLLSWAST